jgi:multisubunit Na+/H+ antiporter MnhE subunit
MLHAAAMVAGLFVIGFVMAQGWTSRDGALLVLAAALASVAVAMRLGGVRKNPFSSAPQLLMLIGARAQAVMRGALSTIRAALAADVTLKPALVRARTGAADGFAQAAAADIISAAPGSVVVETDREGMLVHVINEDTVDSDTLANTHQRAARLLGRGL